MLIPLKNLGLLPNSGGTLLQGPGSRKRIPSRYWLSKFFQRNLMLRRVP